MSADRKPRAASGFTVLELLAVLALVAILAAILLPVVSKVRTTAQAAETSSNMRSLIQAVKVWSQDNDGLMPDSKWYGSRTKLRAGPDFERDWSLHVYLEIPRNRDADEGPTAFTDIAADKIVRGFGRYRRSVVINHFTGIREGREMDAGPVRMINVERPSRMMLFVGGAATENGYPSSLSRGRVEDLNYLFPYGGKNMVGFVDGSVTQMDEPEFLEKLEEIENFRTSAFWTGTGS